MYFMMIPKFLSLVYCYTDIILICFTNEFANLVTLNVYTMDHRSCQLVVTRAACAKDVQYYVAKELALSSTDHKLYEVKSSGGIH